MSLPVLVVGGGPAGIMAAICSATNGVPVVLLEKGRRLGTKMLITGKGRCNLTNVAPVTEMITQYPGNGQFLYSALHTFDNQALISLLSDLGVKVKVERGGRVFPASDMAKDVVSALTGYLYRLRVDIRLNHQATGVSVQEGRATGITVGDCLVRGRAVVVATGGLSYPRTGSTGDGYRWAKDLGHTVNPPLPSLVPLETAEEWPTQLQGLTLKNVTVKAVGDEVLGSEFGEMMFTHFGLTGPIILTLSRYIVQYQAKKPGPVTLFINMKPALKPEQLDARIQRDFLKFSRRQLKNALDDLLPQRMIPVFIELSGIPGDKYVHQVTRVERQHLVSLLQAIPVRITGTRPLAEAIVTAGGVSVKEVNPRTMESNLVSGLFWAGEVLDVDGFTGGYNLQAAFSTGYVAGKYAASR